MSFISYKNHNEDNIIHSLILKNPNKNQSEKVFGLKDIDSITKPDMFINFSIPGSVNIKFLAVLWNIQSDNVLKYANITYTICSILINRIDLIRSTHVLSIYPDPSEFEIKPLVSEENWKRTKDEIFRLSKLDLQARTTIFLNNNISQSQSQSQSQLENKPNETCCICFEEINSNTNSNQVQFDSNSSNLQDQEEPKKNQIDLPCSHIFHYDCIKTWVQKENEQKNSIFRSNSTCPMCRVLLMDKDEESKSTEFEIDSV